MKFTAHNSSNKSLEKALQDAIDTSGSPGRIIGFAFEPQDKKWHVGHWTEEED